MSSLVVIKSISNGLKVFLDKNADFESICRELSEKISQSKGFFKGAKIAVSFEERTISFEEEKQLIDIMEDSGDMTVLYSIGKDSESGESVARVVNRSFNEDSEGNCFGRLYTGSLKKGERLESEAGIVVMGDIEPGATLLSKGSIVVLGGIYGSAIVEASDDESKYFIAASDISAERIRIGKYHYYTKEKAKWLIKPKMQPKICYCRDGIVTVEPVSSDSLRRLSETVCDED
jgi:septum site-determining protein MinC